MVMTETLDRIALPATSVTEFAPKADAILFVAPKIKFERPVRQPGREPGNGYHAVRRPGSEAPPLEEVRAGLTLRST